mmetsp:Transcript_60301/g.165656  ORF Transcript_60301/g.165656 Transcript_60301/m.165656 type:complete len:210 (-) Transcript_60301:1059-1688(-)
MTSLSFSSNRSATGPSRSTPSRATRGPSAAPSRAPRARVWTAFDPPSGASTDQLARSASRSRARSARPRSARSSSRTSCSWRGASVPHLSSRCSKIFSIRSRRRSRSKGWTVSTIPAAPRLRLRLRFRLRLSTSRGASLRAASSRAQLALFRSDEPRTIARAPLMQRIHRSSRPGHRRRRRGAHRRSPRTTRPRPAPSGFTDGAEERSR